MTPSVAERGRTKQVICVSWVPTLATTRELILTDAGYQVTSIVGLEQMDYLWKITEADLLVLAHSVPRENKHLALEIYRQHCNAPVLSLLQPNQSKLPGVDFGVEALNPEDFVRVVRRILDN